MRDMNIASSDHSGVRAVSADIDAARQAASAGRVSEAFESLNALTPGPEASLAHKVMGDIFADRHLDEEAAKEYRRAIRLDDEHAEAHNNLANVLWRKSKDQRAIDHYARAIELRPDYGTARANLALVKAEAGALDEAIALLDSMPIERRTFLMWRSLAMIMRQAGRLDEALEAARKAIQLNEADAESLAVASGILRARGENDEALALARQAIDADPACYAGYIEASVCLRASGAKDEALASARQAVEVAPANARAYDALGSQLLSDGRFEEARLFLQRALDLDPNYSMASFHLGVALEKEERYEDAEKAYKHVIAKRPGFTAASVCLASVFVETGKSSEAEAILREVVGREPENAMAWSNLSRALEGLGRQQEAAEAASKGVELAPDLAEAHVNYGIARQVLGDLPGAQTAFRKALELDPELVPAIFSMAATDSKSTVDLLQSIQSLTRRDDLTDEQRSQLHFAEALIYDSSGEYDRAFAAAAEGNRLEEKRASYDRDKHEQYAEAMLQVFDRGYFDRRADYGSTSAKPVFIVGMPRVGTTLVEQILASHSQVFGAGELTRIPVLAHAIPDFVHTQEHFPASALSLDEPGTLRIASAYLRTLRELAGTTQRITDKLPSNFFYIGLIALLFPNAPIIACEREPLDTFVSGYFVRFRRAIAHTQKQSDFAHFYKVHQRLMAHWNEVLPGRILTVNYERIVADQEAETKRILAHCHLDWEEACMRFHELVRPVRTASSSQVRQPLFDTSVGRAAPYRGHLRELAVALELEAPEAAREGALQ
ncbi:MAG: tetratricopeptide repeat protein [Hyphomicrobiales bacterium]|nr:tetratricopeptide repeat protein [Hyphomicrobiales bacterium]